MYESNAPPWVIFPHVNSFSRLKPKGILTCKLHRNQCIMTQLYWCTASKEMQQHTSLKPKCALCCNEGRRWKKLHHPPFQHLVVYNTNIFQLGTMLFVCESVCCVGGGQGVWSTQISYRKRLGHSVYLNLHGGFSRASFYCHVFNW